MPRSYPIEVIDAEGKRDTVFYNGDCTLWYIKKGLFDHDGARFLIIGTLTNYHSPELIEDYREELMNDKELLEHNIEVVANESWLRAYIKENY